MSGFEQFKRKPLTREELEEQSRGVRKTGEILRGMQEAESAGEKEPAAVATRDERIIQSLENEIREIKNYAQTVPGYAEFQDVKSRVASLSPAERREAFRVFGQKFSDAKKEIEGAARDIKKRQEIIRKLKGKRTGASPFEEAA